MGCHVSGEQLWSWIDREAPELAEHLAVCPECRARAERMRGDIDFLLAGAVDAPPLPETIGPYRILQLLGEGGQALVFLAEQAAPRRAVALKVLKGGGLAGRRQRKQFQRETQTLARLSHPGIATIFEAGRTEDGLLYFAMELVRGRSLLEFVREEGLSQAQTLDLVAGIGAAVHHAHRHGVIHRDLKPSNILVDDSGQPRILDFGLARLTAPDTDISQTRATSARVEGTPRYMSPEQARGRPDLIDARSDVYALGVILYELLTGQPPVPVDVVDEDARRLICEAMPPRPRDLAPHLGADLEAVVLKALEKDPDDRYGDMDALVRDLRRVRAGEPVQASPRGRFYFWRRRMARRRGRVAAILAVAAAATALIWAVTRPAYDVGQTRHDLLDLRCRLLRDGPVEPGFSTALAAPRRYGDLPEAHLVRAQAHCLRRGQNAAAQLLAEELRRSPGAWSLRLMLEEVGHGDADVEARIEELWNEDPGRARSAECWYLRSFATLDAARALAAADSALVRDPDHRLALEAVTWLSWIAGDATRALACSNRLVELDEHPAAWSRFRFSLLVREGRLKEALPEVDRLIEQSPRIQFGHTARAKLARRLGRLDEAIEGFTRSMQITGPAQPANAWLHYHRGTLYWMTGRDEEAIADYRQAYAFLTYPTFANARLYLILHELGRLDEARTALAEARQANVDDTWLGTILDCLAGEITPDELARAADLSDSVRVCESDYYAGEACLAAGRRDEAARWFALAVGTDLSADPDHPLEAVSEWELARWRLDQLD